MEKALIWLYRIIVALSLLYVVIVSSQRGWLPIENDGTVDLIEAHEAAQVEMMWTMIELLGDIKKNTFEIEVEIYIDDK